MLSTCFNQGGHVRNAYFVGCQHCWPSGVLPPSGDGGPLLSLAEARSGQGSSKDGGMDSFPRGDLMLWLSN